MVFHVSGTGQRVIAVKAALRSLGLVEQSPATPPDGHALGAWISLDETLSGVVAAEEALRSGWNVLLRWPADLGARYADRLVALADEAGRQVGIIRPLRRQPEFVALAEAGRASILTLAVDLPQDASIEAFEVLGDLLDVCVSLFGESGLQRTEVESARGDDSSLTALATSIRFQNGALAQLLLSFGDGPTRFHAVAAGGGRSRRALALDPVPLPLPNALIASEAVAFVHAVGRGAPCPVTLSDALETLRIAERVRSAARA